MATSIGRAVAFPARVDPAALAAALEQTLTDLPFLSGRLGGMKKLRLGTLAIRHTGEGVPLTVVRAEGVTLDALAPEHWPRAGVTIAQPAWPWYLERLDVGKKCVGWWGAGAPVGGAGGMHARGGGACGACNRPQGARPSPSAPRCRRFPCPAHHRGASPVLPHSLSAGCCPARSR